MMACDVGAGTGNLTLPLLERGQVVLVPRIVRTPVKLILGFAAPVLVVLDQLPPILNYRDRTGFLGHWPARSGGRQLLGKGGRSFIGRTGIRD